MDLSHLLIRDRLKTVRYLKQPTDEQARDICCNVGAALKLMYPRYDWHVGVNQDWLYILCASLSTRLGMRLPLSAIDAEGKALMRSAGELLERFGCSRDRARESELMAARRDYYGNAIPV
jgi:hypothetical protein